MVGMALAKSMYAIPTWTRTVALVREHSALRAAVVGSLSSDVPSVYACYRFTAKLRVYSDMLDRCLDGVTASLSEQIPEYGHNVAVDGSDMPAYANGQRFRYTTARNAKRSATRTPHGGTGRPSRRARAVRSTATSSTWPSVRLPTCLSRGTSAPPAITSRFTRRR
jgi:hypothetical protein